MSTIQLPMASDYHLSLPDNLTMKYISTKSLKKEVKRQIDHLGDASLCAYDLLIKESCLHDREQVTSFVAHTIHETIAHEMTLRFLDEKYDSIYPSTVRYGLETYHYIKGRYGEDEANIYLMVQVERFASECYFETNIAHLCAYHHALTLSLEKELSFVLCEYLTCIEDAIVSKINYHYIEKAHPYEDQSLYKHLEEQLNKPQIQNHYATFKETSHECTI